MDAFRISVKLFVEDDSQLDAHEFVPVFHSWIQTHAVSDHLLIDVADYAHVHNGPGTLLISHEANFYMDREAGRLGLLYSRKQPAQGSFANRVSQAFSAAREACERLENDPTLAGRIRFRSDEALLRINDRLLAPNTNETFETVTREIEPLLKYIFSGEVQLEHVGTPEKLLEIRVTSAKSPALSR